MSTASRWVRPSEPQKPPIPYRKDTHLGIHRIEPPPPFSAPYWDSAPGHLKEFITRERTATADHLKTLSMVKYCLSQAVLPCDVVQGQTADLRILDELAIGDGRGAQIVTCTASNEPGVSLVAKVYDALYYPFMHDDAPGTPLDIVTQADMDLTGEAAAYNSLNSALGGDLIPRYYGAWAFTQPLLGQLRTVNLILMEHVQGTLLSDINPTVCTKDERLNVLAKVMEAEVVMYHLGVNHYDLAPRNIIISPGHSGLADPKLQIRVIDFNKVEIYALRGGKPSCLTQTQPESPVRYWEDDYPSQMADWIDDEYYDDRGRWNAWIRQRWLDDERFLPPT